MVVCRGQVREKPSTEEEARGYYLSYSSGDPAECVNGLVVWNPRTGRKLRAVEKAEVTFGRMSQEEVGGSRKKKRCPTNNAPLIGFRLSSDAEILLISSDWACKNRAKRAKTCMQYAYVPTELPFCVPPLVVG